MNIDKHPPGTFCWVELATSSQSAAKQFYGSLFGWTAHDSPMGPDAVYTSFKLDGRDAAACHQMLPAGESPNWRLFISVESADDTAARATQSGGTVLMAPIDLEQIGRMAVMQDPTGAAFAIWQPYRHNGIGIRGVDGTLCWADLNTGDRLRAKEFYESVFGWRLIPGKGKDVSTYLHVVNGEEFIGGVLPDEHRDPHSPPHWLPYFAVSDCDATAARVKELGGRVYAEPMTVEGSLRYAVVADPQGAVFALFTQVPRG